MLHPKAVKEFLNKSRDDHSWLKEESESSLDKLLAESSFQPLDARPLDFPQKVSVLLGIAYPRFAFWLDLGLGKTRISLELLNHLWRRKKITKAIIVVYSEASLYGWADQIKEWGFDVPFTIIPKGSGVEKQKRLNTFSEGLLIVSYTSLIHLVSAYQEVKNSKKRKLKISIEQLQILTKGDYCLILDESTKAFTFNSLTFKVCSRISKKAQSTYILAGRPLGRDPQVLWTQHYIADLGESLGETLGLFRAAFFDSKRGYWGGYEYKLKQGGQEALARCLKHRSITFESDDDRTLPKRVKSIERVPLPLESLTYLRNQVELIKKSAGDSKQVNNAFIRMRQISSGFMSLSHEELSEKVIIKFKHNPKLDRLKELIEDIPKSCKFIIFHEFNASGEMLEQAMKSLKIKYGRLWSGSTDIKKIMDSFNNDPKYQCLIINHMVGSFGLNLQVANYQFYYESPVGVISRAQSEKRCWRKGQIKNVYQYDLIVKGTFDQIILDHHAQGNDLFKALIKNPKKLLKSLEAAGETKFKEP